MVKVLVVVLRESRLMPALLEAWQDAGVPGVTIMRSAGVSQVRPWLQLLGFPRAGLVAEASELSQRTLFAIIDDEAVLELAIGEARRIMGDFDAPGNGMLLVLPVDRALGVVRPDMGPAETEAASDTVAFAGSPPWRVRRDTPVADIARHLQLEPTIVHKDSVLDEVARTMLEQPEVHVACVVDDEGYLVGLIDLRTLADQIFFHILPEEFLSEASDLDHALQFADLARRRTAKDAMRPPVWMRPDKSVKEAFRRMHDHQIAGLPIVDDAHRVIGYINLLELLAVCTKPPAAAPKGGERS